MKHSISRKQYQQKHDAMLKYQKSIAPLLPTIRELMLLWDESSTSQTFEKLQNMVELRMVRAIITPAGQTKYSAIA